jgi:SDR family mycofactocin-dependent oxidoreductase
MGKLEGKVAFITGAARGQGRSHALTLAEEGADIIGVDLCTQLDSVDYPMSTPEDLEETVQLVEKLDRRMVAVKADVRDRSALESAVQKGLTEFGRLDIVLANAGIMAHDVKPGPGSEQKFRDSLDVMAVGVWNTLQVTVPVLIEAGRGGAIVLTSSTAGVRVITTNFDGGMDGYNAAKFAVTGLMSSYAGRLAEYGIRVNAVAPTGVGTKMVMNEHFGKFMEANPHVANAYQNALPVPLIEPVDVSKGILYLVSDEGRYVTGHTLVIDAGMTSVGVGGAGGTALA